jgi:iron uptake system EfeUOB component EfeO/EfeM
LQINIISYILASILNKMGVCGMCCNTNTLQVSINLSNEQINTLFTNFIKSNGLQGYEEKLMPDKNRIAARINEISQKISQAGVVCKQCYF